MAIKFGKNSLIGGGGGPPPFPGGGSGPTTVSGRELGRISGPLLADNLRRNGQNLAFETSVMFLDVNNKFVGFNTDTPARTLTINGNSYSDNYNATTTADLGHIAFGGVGTLDQISNAYNENIYITPNQSVDPIIQLTGIGSTGKWGFVGASLQGYADQDFTLDPTGQLVIGDIASTTDIEVDGGIEATGTVTFEGDITLGNDNTDNISFGAEVASNVVPDDDALWNLGTDTQSVGFPTGKNWLTTYSQNLVTSTTIEATNAYLGTLTAGEVRITGNTITNYITDNDYNIVYSGSGLLNIPTFNLDTNGYFNHTTDNRLDFNTLTTGYYKFGGENGVTIPSGTTSQRPTNPEIGIIRYNSDLNYVEVFANVASTSTLTLVTTTADAFTGNTTIYVNSTAGFIVGDTVTSTSVPTAFATGTIILSFVGNTSVTIDKPMTNNLPTNSNLTVQRKWIPIIGTSPVLSEYEVTETMDIWTLILG